MVPPSATFVNAAPIVFRGALSSPAAESSPLPDTYITVPLLVPGAAAASAAVAALADSLPDDPFTLENRPTTRSGADDTDSVDAADAVDSANDANRNRKQTNAVQPAHMASIEHAHSADTPRGVLLPSADEDSYSEHSFAETDDDREAQAIDAALDSLDALIRG